jgi:hypothetical protein
MDTQQQQDDVTEVTGTPEPGTPEPVTAEQPSEQPAAVPDPIAVKAQQALERMSYLTLSLVQQREELAQQEREAELLTADIAQRRLRITAQEEELQRVRGAVTVLNQLQKELAQGAK